MTKKLLFCSLTTFLLGATVPVQAQQPGKIPRIGWLTASSAKAVTSRAEAFRQGLRELGYVEGKNIFVEWRYADGNRDRAQALANELVQLKVAVVVAAGGGATRPLKDATKTIPIIMAQDPDPVGNGHVASLARPGGNITGLSTLAPELSGKRLEMLKETVPKLSRVAVFQTSGSRDYKQTLEEVDLAAKAMGIKLLHVDVQSGKDIEPGFAAANTQRAEGALWMVSGPVYGPHITQITDLAIKKRLPVLYKELSYMESAGLMFYGVSLPDLDRRSATFVDKILKGRSPADLPVEQPIKFEFIVNLKTAKAIRLTFPPNVLARADRVIR